MFDAVKEGIAGLALFIGNWLGPSTSTASLEVSATAPAGQGCAIHCKLHVPWDNEIEQLVDAGIPLRIAFVARCGSSESYLLRTLKFDVAGYTYTFIDSTSHGQKESKKYPMILLALDDYTQWDAIVPGCNAACVFEAFVLQSHVPRLQQDIDMIHIWGWEKAFARFSPARRRER